VSPPTTPSELLAKARIVVCVGTGGVGKTTTAAAIALEAARGGARTLVLTIDPARRLADALGIGELGNEPEALPPALAEQLTIPEGGSLSAMMLDMKGTFDALVTRFAEDEETRQRILANPIYQHVSDALAGSGEYAAMEKVYEMAECGRFDLIVLDTPPSQHALDFLDAPRRLLEFLDSKLVQLLVHPAFSAGRFGFRIFQGTTQKVLGVIERISGIAFLEDISEFLLAFEGMSEGFRQRAHHVQSLLLGPDAGFVLIAAPSTEATHSAKSFLAHLESSRVPLRGIVINRTRRWPEGWQPLTRALEQAGETEGHDPEHAALDRDRSALERAIAESGRPGDAAAAARAAVAAMTEYAGLVGQDMDNTAALRTEASRLGLFMRLIPELPRDVHDLDGLNRIGAHLFDPAADDETSPGASS
jgi:anion-transporting  ArsA/GET3 family ATPase